MILNTILENTHLPVDLSELDTVEECAGNPFEFITGVVYESQMMQLQLEHELLIEEYVNSKNGNIIQESNVIAKFFTTIRNILHKIWEKICAFFKKIFSFFKREKSTSNSIISDAKKTKTPKYLPKNDNEAKRLQIDLNKKVKEKNPNAEAPNVPKPIDIHITLSDVSLCEKVIERATSNDMDDYTDEFMAKMKNVNTISEFTHAINNDLPELVIKSLFLGNFDTNKSVEQNIKNLIKIKKELKITGTDQDKHTLISLSIELTNDEKRINRLFDNTKKELDLAIKEVNEIEKEAEKTDKEIRDMGADNLKTTLDEMFDTSAMPHIQCTMREGYNAINGFFKKSASLTTTISNIVTMIDKAAIQCIVSENRAVKNALRQIINYHERLNSIEKIIED